MLANVGAGRARGAGEGGRDEPRVGLPVLCAEGPAERSITEPGIALAQGLAPEQFELQPVRSNGLAIGFELRHVGLASARASGGRSR